MPVSVIVCTRDRPQDLERCLPSILASTWRDFELVVIDQSRDGATRVLVESLAATDTRVRYVADAGKGLSRARNLSLRATLADIVVFTDDDCQVAPDWLERMVDALHADPQAALAYGSVVPVDCDPAEGFIVGYLPTRPRRLTGKFGKLLDGGIGANMALRREAVQAVGNFDELLGAGGYFPSCEDVDMAYRVLAAGYALLHVPESRVMHYGLRDWVSGSALIRNSYLAYGASTMKYVRAGDFFGLCLFAQQVGLALQAMLEAAIRRRGPFGIGRLMALFAGLRRSFELALAPGGRVYQARG